MADTSLTKLTQADKLLAEVATIEDALSLINLAEAARVYAQEIERSLSAANYATQIKLRAERRLADIIDRGQESGEVATQGENRFSRGPESGPLLSDLGVQKQRLGEARQLRDAFTEEDLTERGEQATATNAVLSRNGLLQEARAMLSDRRAEAKQELREFEQEFQPPGFDAEREGNLVAERGALFRLCRDISRLEDPEDFLVHHKHRIGDRIQVIEEAYVWLNNFLTLWRSES